MLSVIRLRMSQHDSLRLNSWKRLFEFMGTQNVWSVKMDETTLRDRHSPERRKRQECRNASRLFIAERSDKETSF